MKLVEKNLPSPLPSGNDQDKITKKEISTLSIMRDTYVLFLTQIVISGSLLILSFYLTQAVLGSRISSFLTKRAQGKKGSKI
jgi:hypothetical protein